MKNSVYLSMTLLLGLLFSKSSFAQEKDAILQGRVATENNLPVESAAVLLKGTPYGAVTDKMGNYTISIPHGNYVFVVSSIGHATVKLPIEVTVGTNKKDVILQSKNQDLDEVVLVGNRHSLLDKKTTYVARMPLANLENPQVYSVIGDALIKQQMAVDINAAIRNAPGTVPQKYPSGGLAILTRGFSAGVNARNGMETISGRSSLDIANVERIEVLKGPSGTLFGSSVSSFGGVVNLVTKRPFETNATEISYTTGSYGLHRLTADINAPLNETKTVLLRLNTAVHREKSFLEYGFNNTFLLAPSLTYRANEKLTFNLDLEMFQVNNTRQMYTRFLPAAGFTNPENIPMGYRATLFHDDADAETVATKVFAEATYKMSDHWNSTTLFSFAGEDVDHSYQYYPTWISPTQVTRSASRYGPINDYYTNLQQNFNGTFHTGTVAHKLLLGANYRHYTGKFDYGTSGVVDTVDVTGSFLPLTKREIDAKLNQIQFPVANLQTFSVYVSDVLSLSDRFSAMLSLRVDHFKREELEASDGYRQTSLAPKFGAVYQISKDKVSIFANYMNGFQNRAPINQPDGSRLVLDPTYANQWETGVKAELLNKMLGLTVSYYHIGIDNATRTNADLFTVQDGKQVSKGVEVELVSAPVQGLQIVAGYAYNDNKIVKSSDPAIEGNKATGAPENIANAWISYTFHGRLKGLGLGLGAHSVDNSFFASDNQYYLPQYNLLDASIFYEEPTWRLGMKLNNITGENYWGAYGEPGTPTNFMANLTLKF